MASSSGRRVPILVKPPGATCAFPVNRDSSLEDLAREAGESLTNVAREMYDGDDVRFIGKTRLEATLLSLAFDAPHDPSARSEFIDRVLGKPKQRVDNVNVNINLLDYLDMVNAEEQASPTLTAEFSVAPDADGEERGMFE